MNWFTAKIYQKDTDNLIFEMPIQAPMHNSVEGRFEQFLNENPPYKELLKSIGDYSFRSEHMNKHLEQFQQTGS